MHSNLYVYLSAKATSDCNSRSAIVLMPPCLVTGFGTALNPIYSLECHIYTDRCYWFDSTEQIYKRAIQNTIQNFYLPNAFLTKSL